MTRYAEHVSTRQTPQSEKADPRQVENSAGGHTFALDKWARLTRWLVLGAEGGSYYTSERKLTKDNAVTITQCLDEDGPRAVKEIAELSTSGRTPKNDPAIFALAMAAGHGNLETRKAALTALPMVCRTGTHLFQFVESVRQFRGGGRGLRRAIGAWYVGRKADSLAYQAVKYRQRKLSDEQTWSHRDILRIYGRGDMPKHTDIHAAVLRWIVAKNMDERTIERKSGATMNYPALDVELPSIIQGFEALQGCTNTKEAVKLIEKHRLTHEMVPSELKNDVKVWEALLDEMPMTAMIRNLAKMSAVGLLKPLGDAIDTVTARLADVERLRKARIHPLAVLNALNTYRLGHGIRGSLTWDPVPQITDALDEAFYLAFKTIEPTGKHILLALDVSGSMTGGTLAGMPGITPRVGSAAMAMTTMRTEKHYHVVGFTCASRGSHGWWGRSRRISDPDEGISTLNLSAKQRLDTVVDKISNLPFSGTDCSLPMLWALKHDVPVDAFYIYTDNETWAGSIHPHQALERYRQKMGRDAKLIVVGMVSNGFTIANPSDAGMLDVVGFDTAAPAVMADFTRGGF